MAVAPQNTILLLEDIDSAFLSRENFVEGKKNFKTKLKIRLLALYNFTTAFSLFCSHMSLTIISFCKAP